MGTTLTELNRTLKRILAKTGSPTLVMHRTKSVRLDLNSTNSRLSNILTELQTQGDVLDTIDVDTGGIKTDTALMVTDLAAIEVLLTTLNTLTTTIDSVLDEMNTKLTTIQNIDYFLGNGEDAEDLLSELMSIDQNWNLLSVNQLNLAAILAAVLNNATSGRQDTAQTTLDTIAQFTRLAIEDAADVEPHHTVPTGAGAVTTSGSLLFYTEHAVPSGLFKVRLTVPSGEEWQLTWASIKLRTQDVAVTMTLITFSEADDDIQLIISQSLNNTTRSSYDELGGETTTGGATRRLMGSQLWMIPGSYIEWASAAEIDASTISELDLLINRRNI